ncbi:ATP-binding cassette domain-containing protein [Salinimonas chungwhensis]|uniref:ATP-binding cassette domain-containing protein n=1 Tax=Salinimonas chungwhensis TaxID=265425 RepID=UPI000382C45D|nr:ATP-binding cassette domain-containing protein [Salinimonas chungwhensis]
MKLNALILDEVEVINNHHRLIRVNTRVSAGSVLTIMGPSGVGKSLLLSAIAGVLPAPFRQQGTIKIGDQDITALPAHRRGLGILYQDPLLFEHLSVAQNIIFGMPPGTNKYVQAEELLAGVGLENYGRKAVQTLSGGQQARVALLRTLAAQPRAVLLDEPFSKLDMQTRAQTRKWVFDTIRQNKLPCIMVTHDEQDARAAEGEVVTVSNSTETI